MIHKEPYFNQKHCISLTFTPHPSFLLFFFLLLWLHVSQNNINIIIPPLIAKSSSLHSPASFLSFWLNIYLYIFWCFLKTSRRIASSIWVRVREREGYASQIEVENTTSLSTVQVIVLFAREILLHLFFPILSLCVQKRGPWQSIMLIQELRDLL